MPQQLTTYKNNNTLFVDMPKEFDSFKVDQIREQLDTLVNQHHKHICLDFKDNQFIDSSGIGAIVFLFKRLRQSETQLDLINVNDQPLKLMTMLHVDRAIPVNRPLSHSAA